MNPTIPLISSEVAGPLGIMHLPRLWQKSSLEAVGKLHPDYPAAGRGYDQMLLSALGIDVDAFVNFMKTERPSYVQLEAWVKAYPGAKLDKASIFKANNATRSYIHDDATRKAILEAVGLEDDGSVNPGAIDLNNLDDWNAFWKQEIRE